MAIVPATVLSRFRGDGTAALLDRCAIALSGACSVHCLLMPAALTLLPALGGSALADESFHLALLMLIVPASVVALALGCRRHKDALVMALGLAGLVLLGTAAVLGHAWLGDGGERAMTVAGSIAIVAGHARNFRLCRGAACVH